MSMEFVSEALKPFCGFSLYHGQAAVTTHCLYPSNSAVTVYISGGPRSALVSDEGAAIDVLSEHNRAIPNPTRYLKRFCGSGVTAVGYKLASLPVPVEQLTAAVILVANASAAAAHWGIEHIKAKRRRDLKLELRSVLAEWYPKERIQHDGHLTGKSNRRYRFDNLVTLEHQRLLVLDGVLPDPNSINSHAISHLDLKERHDENIVQRIVYDEEDDWGSADLNLLQMAANLVPLSQVSRSLVRLEGSAH